jgi:hypothetical protein
MTARPGLAVRVRDPPEGNRGCGEGHKHLEARNSDSSLPFSLQEEKTAWLDFRSTKSHRRLRSVSAANAGQA